MIIKCLKFDNPFNLVFQIFLTQNLDLFTFAYYVIFVS